MAAGKYPKPKPLKSHRCSDCDLIHWTPEDKEALRTHFLLCFGCDEKVFYEYLVKESVWRDEAGLDFEAGVLHLPCLEKILGRKLTLDDFREAISGDHSINDAVRWAYSKQT